MRNYAVDIGGDMPEISELEEKKIREIIAENKRLKEQLKNLRYPISQEGNLLSIPLEKLTELAKLELKNLNFSYGPVEAYAVEFVKIANNQFKENRTKELFFNWEYFQDYVTDKCLKRDRKNNITLKKSFRSRCKKYGICFKIERKTGTITVKRCKRRLS